MRFHAKHRGRGGQVMLEFLIVGGVLLVLTVMLTLLLYTFKEHGGRMIDLIARY